VGAAKTVKQFALYEPRRSWSGRNCSIIYQYSAGESHAASLQIVGFSSSRSVKKPIEALIFASFHQGKEDAPQVQRTTLNGNALKIKQQNSAK
jgi:hypothetical protein